MHPDDLLHGCLALARHAGQAILEVYQSDFEVVQKADDSPLTRADLASHNIIIRGLARLTPDVPVLSEEAAGRDWQIRRQWRRYWLVDPLDGTREFIKQNGEFTVNIALIEDHRPVLGVVSAPALDCYWFALAGQSAWRFCATQPDQQPAAGTAERIRTRPAAQPPVVIASRSHPSAELEQYLEQLPEHLRLSVGSSLKFCRIAEGSADLYPRPGPTSEWDTAAAQCVVEQAGGKVITAIGDPLLYNCKESLLNPPFLVIGDASFPWPLLKTEY